MANLHGSDLSGAKLISADLREVNLSGAPVTAKFAEEIDGDAYGANAGPAVDESLALVGLA